MTTKDVEKLCPKAENISVTENGGALTVGMKVGLFAQSVNIGNNTNRQDWQAQVLNLYRDLQGMNREVEYQQRAAKS